MANKLTAPSKLSKLITETKRGVTRVQIEANSTSYALFHNFNDIITAYIYTVLLKMFYV